MASVVFYMEDGTTLVHKLESDITTIGRHPDNNVVLTCPSSSSKHAVIKAADEGYYVQDLGSSNGTRVNGAEIEEALLKDGDRVGFGDVQSVFYAGDASLVLEEKPGAARLAPPLPPVSLPPPSAAASLEPAPRTPPAQPPGTLTEPGEACVWQAGSGQLPGHDGERLHDGDHCDEPVCHRLRRRAGHAALEGNGRQPL